MDMWVRMSDDQVIRGAYDKRFASVDITSHQYNIKRVAVFYGAEIWYRHPLVDEPGYYVQVERTTEILDGFRRYEVVREFPVTMEQREVFTQFSNEQIDKLSI